MLASPVWAAPVKIAVPVPAGKKSSGAAKVRSALVAALNEQGAKAVTNGDADFEIRLTVKKAPKKRFVAEAQLLGNDGKVVKTVRATYGKGGAAKAGSELGTALGRAAVAERDRGAAEVKAPRLDSTPPPPPPPPPPMTRIEPKDEAPTLKTEGRGNKPKSGEDQLLRLSLGGGTQMLSAYTVAVDGQVTGLAYELSPLLLLTGAARVHVPGTGLLIGAFVSFVPVQYSVVVDPPVDPAQPKGRFLSIGGELGYELALSQWDDGGRFVLTPLLAGTWASMGVDSQGDNSVVLSYSGLDLLGGVRLGVLPTAALALEADLRGGLIVGYKESPTTTGASASGIALRFGGGARYWVNELFGLYLSVGYHFRQVGFSGSGSRVGFFGDPQLVDATVFSGDLQAQAGVHLAL
jgi:hypothetical protein